MGGGAVSEGEGLLRIQLLNFRQGEVCCKEAALGAAIRQRGRPPACMRCGQAVAPQHCMLLLQHLQGALRCAAGALHAAERISPAVGKLRALANVCAVVQREVMPADELPVAGAHLYEKQCMQLCQRLAMMHVAPGMLHSWHARGGRACTTSISK